MAVEAAMRQAGLAHDLVQPDAVETLLAKQPRRHVHDLGPVLGRLFPADPHGALLFLNHRILTD